MSRYFFASDSELGMNGLDVSSENDTPIALSSKQRRQLRKIAPTQVQQAIQQFLTMQQQEIDDEDSVDLARKARVEKYKVQSSLQEQQAHAVLVVQAENKVKQSSITNFGDAFNEYREVVEGKVGV